MIIQAFLTALLAAIALFVAMQRTTSRLVRAAFLGVIATGAAFVWVPNETNAIAQAVGVGRGADLILYLWVVITLAVMLMLYLKVIRMGRRLTQLTRAIALAHAEEPDPSCQEK